MGNEETMGTMTNAIDNMAEAFGLAEQNDNDLVKLRVVVVGDILTLTDQGSTFTILGNENGWVKVALDEEQVGYVSSDYVYIDYVYETGVEKTLDLLLPMYIKDILYGIILDAKISEHSARMNSMKNATDNAKEVIEKLQLLYNRARQSAITTELIDIIGGANAIGGDN